MGRQEVEESLLAGHDLRLAKNVRADTLLDEEWQACVAQADSNAGETLGLLVKYNSTLRDAKAIIFAASSQGNVPSVVRLGLALFFGKVLSPMGKAAEQCHEWFSKNNCMVCADMCASMLFDVDHRVRTIAVKSLAIGAIAQPVAVGRAKDEILRPLSAGSASVREDGLAAIRACFSVLPRDTVLSIAAMLVDDDDAVRHTSRAVLIDVVRGERTPRGGGDGSRRHDEMLEGLVKGWFRDSDVPHTPHASHHGTPLATPRSGVAAIAEETDAVCDEDLDPRSLLLLLTARQKAPFDLNVEQRISVRSALVSILPRGYPPAVHAAQKLAQSGGGEGELEEAEDLRSVAAAATTLALLGPGVSPIYTFSRAHTHARALSLCVCVCVCVCD
jgi:hypothetical protein